MKKQYLTLLLLITALYQPLISQSSGVNRKVLLTLQPGEKIMYAESCLSLSISDNQVMLVTKIGEKIYVHRNGQRQGPFEDLEEANVQACPEDENFDADCSIYETPNTEFDPKIMLTNNDGTYSIQLNNKKYGPYPSITQLHLWPDKSGFVAITMDREMKSKLVTSEGLNLALNGEIEKLQFSPKGKKFVFAFRERQEMDMDILKMDFSKMTQEEIISFAKKQEEKAKNAPTLNSYIYVNGTTKLGPYDLNAFYSNNPGFTKTGGDSWIMTLDNALYINGTKVKDFPDVDLNTCRIWISGDGKRYVIVSYDKVIFSDGKIYNNPLEPSAIEKDGKVIVRWVSLENEKDLIIYSKEL